MPVRTTCSDSRSRPASSAESGAALSSARLTWLGWLAWGGWFG